MLKSTLKSQQQEAQSEIQDIARYEAEASIRHVKDIIKQPHRRHQNPVKLKKRRIAVLLGNGACLICRPSRNGRQVGQGAP